MDALWRANAVPYGLRPVEISVRGTGRSKARPQSNRVSVFRDALEVCELEPEPGKPWRIFAEPLPTGFCTVSPSVRYRRASSRAQRTVLRADPPRDLPSHGETVAFFWMRTG
jgi:hypothetical protein